MTPRRSLWAAAALCATVVAASMLSAPLAQERKPPRQDYNSGAYLFKAFCASCHGDNGKGDGAISNLLQRDPGDLTRLSARAGGVFPRDQVHRAIAGRPALPGHIRRDMPAFAEVFQITEGRDERVIAERIDALVAHLASLQRVP